LSSQIFVFSLADLVSPDAPAHPLPDIERSIIPSSVDPAYHLQLNASEIVSNPAVPNVLYASNRWELHIKEKDSSYAGEEQEGDAIAIALLSSDGSKIESITHVRTGCDAVRAMCPSPDGKYVALAGQEGGGVEIWKVEGQRGDQWKLAGKNPEITNITDIVWV
jgi:6-phosphogluconolactonase (cycloisomerase 2 family)